MGGRTALHLAANQGHTAVVEALFSSDNKLNVEDKHKLDVNLQDNEGRTPLHLAVKGEHPEVVRRILQDSRVTMKKDNDDKIPLDLLVCSEPCRSNILAEFLLRTPY